MVESQKKIEGISENTCRDLKKIVKFLRNFGEFQEILT